MNNVLKLTLLCLKNDFYSFWGGLWHSPGATQARPMASGTEFETADLDSVINVIGLTPSDPLDTFVEIWYQVFLWALFSSLFVHFVAAVVAFSMLRKQQIGRFTPLLILLMGLVAPLTGGALTSAVIAGVYRAARFHMMPFYALVWGCGQTVFAVVMSYTRVLATLWPCFWMTRQRGLARMSVLCTSEEETASTSSVATCLAQLCGPSCHPTNALSCSPCYLFMCAPAVCVVHRRGCVIVCHFQLTQPTGSWSVVWPFAATLAWCFLISDVIFFLSYAFRKMKLSQIVFSALATAIKQINVWHCAYEKESFMWLPRSFFKLCSLYGSEHPCQALWRHFGVSEWKWLPSAVVCWHNHVISTLVGASPHNSLPAQESEIISQFFVNF